jgi:hypothetical protein
MNIADELRKLQELHRTGALSDEEFAQAKAAVLSGTAPAPGSTRPEKDLFPIDPYDSLTPGRLLTLQIIAGSVIGGVVAFLGVALYLVLVQHFGGGTRQPGELPIVSSVAVALFVIQAPLSFIVPNLQTRSALRRILAGTWAPRRGVSAVLHPTTGGKLLGVYQTTLIVGLALLEGVALLGGIAYLVEGQPFAVGVAAVAIVLMLARFPTEGRARRWLKRQADTLAELNNARGGTQGRRV